MWIEDGWFGSWRVPCVAAVVLAAVGCVSGGGGEDVLQPVMVSGVAAGPVTLATVNDQWRGSRCQVRVPLVVKKGKDSQGWSVGPWAVAPTLPGDRGVKIRLAVSDRDRLLRSGYLYRKRTVRAGTMFVARGWRLTNPRKERGLVLDLEVEGTGVLARIEFDKADRLDDLEDVERLSRIELFQLLGPADVGREAAREGVQAPAVVPASMVVQRPSVAPSVEVLGASVTPVTVGRGEKVDLVVTYRVFGLADGTSLEVEEARFLARDEVVLGSFSEDVPRGNGTFTSVQTINVATGLEPGIYRFRAQVTLAGVSGEGTAIFEVR